VTGRLKLPAVNATAIRVSAANALIGRLPTRERDSLIGVCSRVDLELSSILCETDERFTHAYFPLTGFISLVTTLGQRPPLEMGLIGNEGMLGATLSLDVRLAPVRGVVQGEGQALRVPVPALLRELRTSPVLLQTLHRYQYVLRAQLLQNAACTHFHEIEPRLARWLLMTHDRADGDQFHLTHSFLADMLGVRRSGVSVAAGTLQAGKLIRYSRGNISILDRYGLEAAACECYEAMRNAHVNVLGRPRKPQVNTRARAG
jgi:CRP-like cAMP-binding protein